MVDPGESLTGALHSNLGVVGVVGVICMDLCDDVVKQNLMISIIRKLGI